MIEVNGRTADDTKRFDSTPVERIPVNNGPIADMGVSPDGRRLIVTNHARDSISVIGTGACRVLETIVDLSEPFAVAMSGTDANRVYVSSVSAAYDSIHIVDVVTNTVVAQHRLACSVSDLAVSPDGKRIYVGRNGRRGAEIAVVDTATGELDALPLASTPGSTTECVRLSSDGSRLYVGANGPFGGRLAVIDTPGRSDGRASGRSRVVGTVDLGLPIRDVALSSDGATAYVASCGPEGGAVLDVIDTRTNKVTGTRKIGDLAGTLTRLTLSSDGRRAYLVSDESIAVVCTDTHDVIGNIGVAQHPSCVVESPDGRWLYVADYSGVVTAASIEQRGNNEVPSAVTKPLRHQAALV